MPCPEPRGLHETGREFIKVLGGATAVVTCCARAAARADATGRRTYEYHRERSASNSTGRGVRAWFAGTGLDTRWQLANRVSLGRGNANLYRKYAPELVALAPDVLLATGGTGVGALQQVTSTIPIVFVGTTDPVNRGLIASMARPGGNTTGFIEFEYSLSGKWLELLKQIAPSVSRVAVVRDPVEFSGLAKWLPSRRRRRDSV